MRNMRTAFRKRYGFCRRRLPVNWAYNALHVEVPLAARHSRAYCRGLVELFQRLRASSLNSTRGDPKGLSHPLAEVQILIITIGYKRLSPNGLGLTTGLGTGRNTAETHKVNLEDLHELID